MPSIDGFPPAGIWDMPRYKIGPEMEYSEWEKENYYKEWGEIIDLVYNSPSVGVYVPFNEAWGQFDTVKTTEWTKVYDRRDLSILRAVVIISLSVTFWTGIIIRTR